MFFFAVFCIFFSTSSLVSWSFGEFVTEKMSSRMDTSKCVFTPTGGKAPRKALAVRAAKRSAPKCGGVKKDGYVRTDITMELGDSQTRVGERKRKAALAAGGGSFEGEPSPPASIVLRLPMVQSYPLDVPTKRAALAVFDQQVDGLTRKICGHAAKRERKRKAAKALPKAPKAASDKDEQEADGVCAGSEAAKEAGEQSDSEEESEEELPEGYQKGWYGPVPCEE
jgi:hypothetical protein